MDTAHAIHDALTTTTLELGGTVPTGFLTSFDMYRFKAPEAVFVDRLRVHLGEHFTVELGAPRKLQQWVIMHHGRPRFVFSLPKVSNGARTIKDANIPLWRTLLSTSGAPPQGWPPSPRRGPSFGPR